MTKTIEQEALDLINEVRVEFRLPRDVRLYRNTVPVHEALCCVIEQLRAEREAHAATKAEFEAFRQEVSDAVEEWVTADRRGPEPRRRASENLTTFISPKPKPDPVVEAIRDMALTDATQDDADRLRAALAARGLKLVEIELMLTDRRRIPERALDEAAAKERAKVVAWFRSPAWQSRHPEDAALARLIGQMIENGEHHHDPA